MEIEDQKMDLYNNLSASFKGGGVNKLIGE